MNERNTAMKRTFSLIFCLLLLLSLAACGNKTDDESTAEPTTATEYKGPTLDEMSPPSMSTAIPIELPKTYAEVDKSDFKPIKKGDSFWPETEASSVYSSGGTQYFIMGKGVVYAIIDGGNDVFYSAYYDKDGKLTFLGDNDKNWYFNADGDFDYMTYTYTTVSGTQVVSFYEGEDTRFAVYGGQTYYDGALNEMSGEEQVKLVTRVAAAFSMMGGLSDR